MAAQVALRRQQAQEEAEARELGIRLLRTEADLDKDDDNESGGDHGSSLVNNKEKVKGGTSSLTAAAAKRKAAKSGNLMNFLNSYLYSESCQAFETKQRTLSRSGCKFWLPDEKRAQELTSLHLHIETDANKS